MLKFILSSFVLLASTVTGVVVTASMASSAVQSGAATSVQGATAYVLPVKGTVTRISASGPRVAIGQSLGSLAPAYPYGCDRIRVWRPLSEAGLQKKTKVLKVDLSICSADALSTTQPRLTTLALAGKWIVWGSEAGGNITEEYFNYQRLHNTGQSPGHVAESAVETGSSPHVGARWKPIRGYGSASSYKGVLAWKSWTTCYYDVPWSYVWETCPSDAEVACEPEFEADPSDATLEEEALQLCKAAVNVAHFAPGTVNSYWEAGTGYTGGPEVMSLLSGDEAMEAVAVAGSGSTFRLAILDVPDVFFESTNKLSMTNKLLSEGTLRVFDIGGSEVANFPMPAGTFHGFAMNKGNLYTMRETAPSAGELDGERHLEVYNIASGVMTDSFPVVSGGSGVALSKWKGHGHVVVYKRNNSLRGLRITDGATFKIALPAKKSISDWEVTPKGIYYSFNNSKKKTFQGRVMYIPTKAMHSLFD